MSYINQARNNWGNTWYIGDIKFIGIWEGHNRIYLKTIISYKTGDWGHMFKEMINVVKEHKLELNFNGSLLL